MTILRSAIVLTALSCSPALADNHDTGNIPYCGDIDSGLAEPSPICEVWDGDIPAQPSTGPWMPCPNGAYFEGFHCIEVPETYQPVGSIKLRGEALADVGLAMFDDQDVIAVIIPAALPKTCDTAFCAGEVAPYRDFWWQPRHRSRPGQDEDRRGRQRAEAPSIDQPDAPDEPERNDPPSRDVPGMRDGKHIH